MRRVSPMARALGALALLSVLTIGVPVALVQLGNPLPASLPSLSSLGEAFASSSLSDTVLINVMAVVCWLAWAAFAASVVLEVIRSVTTSGRIRGPFHFAVAPLIGSILLLLPSHSMGHVATPALDLVSLQQPAAATTQTVPLANLPPQVVVQSGDSLWKIASDELGDGSKWPQVWEANKDRSEGEQRFTNPNRIYPGWEVVVPGAYAAVPPELPHGTDAAVPPGDSTDVPTTLPTPESQPQVLPAPVQQLSAEDQVAKQPERTAPAPHASSSISDPVLGAGIGISALVAGLIIRRLDLLRSLQRRRRRPDRVVPLPPRAAEATERTLRAISTDDAIDWIDAGLRLLTKRLREDEVVPTPSILCVRAGAMGLEFLLDKPQAVAPRGFQVMDGGHSWTIGGSLSLSEVRLETTDESPFLMSLVTVGESPEGAVLLDLETVGALGINGSKNEARAFVTGAALELTSAPWAVEVSVLVTEPIETLMKVSGIRHVSAENVAPILQGQLNSVGQNLAQFSSTADARRRESAGESWAPTVVLSTAPGAAAMLAPIVVGRPAMGVATVGRTNSSALNVYLTFEPGKVTLQPMGMTLKSTLIDDQTATHAAQLIESAQGDDVASVVDIADGPASFDVADIQPQPEGFWNPEIDVRVLGPVEITGCDVSRSERRRHITESLAYLAVHHDRPVPSERLRDALWPERVSQSTFKVVMSKTRAAIGNDAKGQPHLPVASQGAYRLGPFVGCDWVRFDVLVRTARMLPSHEAMDQFCKALELVRGAPFADTEARAYAWVDSELIRSQIETGIVDAANALGELAFESGDHELATWAARQGLRAVAGQEMLYRLLMRAADMSGDHDEVDRLMREIDRLAEALDPVAGAQLETLDLHQHLTRMRRARHAQ